MLGLAHWSSHHPCWECDAQSFAGCDPTQHFKEIDLEKSKFEIASHARCLEKPSSEHPVFQLPNARAKMCRGDPLHILFSKGLYSHLTGSILHYAGYWEGPGKACVERPWKRLGLIFEAIQEEYKDQKLDNRLTNLKLSMFTDANKPWATTASLHIKAGEARHLLPALVPVLEKVFAGTMKEEESKMIHAASSLEKLVKLLDAAGEFLTPAEFATARVFADIQMASFLVFGKEQEFICHCCKTSHFHPPCDELQVWKPQKTMVFPRGRLCWTHLQDVPQHFFWCQLHQADNQIMP